MRSFGVKMFNFTVFATLRVEMGRFRALKCIFDPMCDWKSCSARRDESIPLYSDTSTKKTVPHPHCILVNPIRNLVLKLLLASPGWCKNRLTFVLLEKYIPSFLSDLLFHPLIQSSPALPSHCCSKNCGYRWVLHSCKEGQAIIIRMANKQK